MENNIENKHKFFSLYFGQDVYMFDETHPCVNKMTYWNIIENDNDNNDFLLLKPLSSITDDDAIEVAKILSFHDGEGVLVFNQKDRVSIYDKYNDEPHMINVLHIFYSLEIFSLDEEGKVFQYDWDRLIKCTDYLRLKGYYLGDGNEIEYGWVQLKEN